MMCIFKRGLPFVLALVIGVALADLRQLAGSLKVKQTEQDAMQTIPHSRTWLLIHSQPTPNFPKDVDQNYECSFVRLRVRLDASGTVSMVAADAPMLQSSCIEAAVDAAKRIHFTPATEDKRPVSVIASIEYGFNEMHALIVNPKTGRRHCLNHKYPTSFPLQIVSVDGANESEGWRVIYE